MTIIIGEGRTGIIGRKSLRSLKSFKILNWWMTKVTWYFHHGIGYYYGAFFDKNLTVELSTFRHIKIFGESIISGSRFENYLCLYEDFDSMNLHEERIAWPIVCRIHKYSSCRILLYLCKQYFSFPYLHQSKDLRHIRLLHHGIYHHGWHFIWIKNVLLGIYFCSCVYELWLIWPMNQVGPRFLSIISQ